MHLSHLEILQFKNVSEAKIDLAEKVNCFLGNNGAGKTTLLDAIYYLAFCKSFFNPIDSQNIQYEGGFFMLDSKFVLDGEDERIYCGQKRNEKKKFKRNEKEYDRLADHIGTIPLVMIAPSDTDLIREGSDVRRKFYGWYHFSIQSCLSGYPHAIQSIAGAAQCHAEASVGRGEKV